MEVSIISIPHTGTNFTKRLFRDLGWQDSGLTESGHTGNTFYTGHIGDPLMESAALEKAKTMPLICPFRHPYRTEASWLKQERGTSEELVSCYRTLFTKFKPLHPYIMAVDSPLRAGCLKALREGLGLDLKTDWSVVNTKANTYEMALDEFTPSEVIKDYAEEINQFLEAYYGRQRKGKRV